MRNAIEARGQRILGCKLIQVRRLLTLSDSVDLLVLQHDDENVREGGNGRGFGLRECRLHGGREGDGQEAAERQRHETEGSSTRHDGHGGGATWDGMEPQWWQILGTRRARVAAPR